MSINDKEIGQRMRSCRQGLGISVSRAAFDLNVSMDHYRKLESGHRSATVEFLASFSENYHVSIDYLLFGRSAFPEIQEELDEAIKKLLYIRKLI